MVADLRTEGKVQGIGPARSQELRCEAKGGTRCRLWVLLVVLGTLKQEVGSGSPGNSEWKKRICVYWRGNRWWDKGWGEGFSLSLVQEFVGVILL